MNSLSTPKTTKVLLDRAIDILSNGTGVQIRDFAFSLYPAEMAPVLEALVPEHRAKIWMVIPPSVMGEILVEVNEDVGRQLLNITDRQDLIAACQSLSSDKSVDLLKVLPEPLQSQVIETLGAQKRSHLDDRLHYEQDTAGGLMSSEVLTVRADVTLDVVARYLRLRGRVPSAIDSLVVVDRNYVYQGVLPLSRFLSEDPEIRVADVMDAQLRAVHYAMSSRELAVLFEQKKWLSAPVVDDVGRVLGIIGLNDVLTIIRDEADHSLMGMAGLIDDHDMFAPILSSARRRAVWLGINLLTAFLAAWVIDLFEDTIQQIVALAVLMPIVASMGGIAGSQTLTLVIRGLALQQVSTGNAWQLLFKELSVGFVNGIIWALVVAGVAGFWFHDMHLGFLLGSAMVINLLCAALSGVSIPLALNRLGIDPALAGGVLLTTVTDVVGFMAFLGLATLFLL